MPSDERMKAARYREKAEQLRAIAEQDINQDSRSVLIQVAESYEQMARALEAAVDRASDISLGNPNP